MWRYASVQEARRIVLAGAVGGAGVVLASLVVGWLTDDLRALPLSVTTFGAVLTMLGSGAIRFQSRLFATAQRPGNGDGQRVLIVGAGSAGSMILKDLLRSPSLGLRPVGLGDDDRRKLGRRLHGIPVLGPRAAIPALVEDSTPTWRCWRSPRQPASWSARSSRCASAPGSPSRPSPACTSSSAARSAPATSATCASRTSVGVAARVVGRADTVARALPPAVLALAVALVVALVASAAFSVGPHRTDLRSAPPPDARGRICPGVRD
jgi:hypothetical protein